MFATVKMFFPIVAVEGVDSHALAGGGVNKFPVAKIDAAVRGAFFIGRKEYQITGFKFIWGGLQAKLVLRIRRARQADAVLGKNIL